MEVTDENTPYMQVYKKYQPDIWTPELREMTMFDLMDEHLETESLQDGHGLRRLGVGSGRPLGGRGHPGRPLRPASHAPQHRQEQHPARRPARLLPRHPPGRRTPGAVIRTSCPVDEILIDDGRAVGVRLRETAASGGKTIRARRP